MLRQGGGGLRLLVYRIIRRRLRILGGGGWMYQHGAATGTALRVVLVEAWELVL